MNFSFVEISFRQNNVSMGDCIWLQLTWFHKCVLIYRKKNQTLKLPKPKANKMELHAYWRLLYSHFQYFIRNYIRVQYVNRNSNKIRVGLDFFHLPHINLFIHYFILLTANIRSICHGTHTVVRDHTRFFGWSTKWFARQQNKVLKISPQPPWPFEFEFVHYKLWSVCNVYVCGQRSA